MFLSEISIKRPVFTTMVVIGLMTLGLLGMRNLGVDLFPDVAFPIVVVNTVYPGAGPEETEQQVTKKVEEAVASINGVDQVRSWSRDSVSTVLIQFKLEADVKQAATDVRDRMAGIRGQLPDDIRDPIIQRFDPSAAPILTYVVASSRNSAETRQLVEDDIKPRLESIDGVASVVVKGGLEREVHVYVDPVQAESLGLSLAQIAQQLQSEGFDLPGGRVTQGGSELSVKTSGRFRTLEELGGVVLATAQNGSQTLLRDVARIEDGFKDVRSKTFLDGQEAVSFDIQKQSGSNTVAIADNVFKAMGKLEAQLPRDVKLVKTIDSSTFIRSNIHHVTQEIIFGGLMAVLIIFLFMLDWRSTMISALALPTSVVTTFLAMWWMGFSFNMMSLLALSLSIGLLIDDAVVVRENIYRHMEMGKDPITAARVGTAEIGLAVMATTFTIVAVFVPVGFMGGIVGKMFKQFGLTVAAAVLVSLFISFTLDPMMSARVVKPIKPGHHEELKHGRFTGPIVRFYDRLDVWYRGVLAWALSHRALVVVGATALFLLSLFLTPFMGKEFMSPEDRGEFKVNYELPAGTSIAETERITRDLERTLRQNEEVKTLFTTVGVSDAANTGSIRVMTTKAAERPGLTQAMIQEDLRQRLKGTPGLIFNVADVGLIEGGQEFPVTINVRGDDFEKLQKVGRDIVALMRRTRGATDIDLTYRAGLPEASVRVDRARAADLGVAVGTVAQTLRLGLEGQVVAKYRQGDRDVDIRVQLPPEDRQNVERLGQLAVPSTGRRVGAMPTGRLVRVSDVARTESGTGPSTIERMNRQRQVTINASLQGGASLGGVVSEIQAGIAQMDLPEGVSVAFVGQAERMQETFSNMGLALGIAVLFIYFVLASQFESFVHPLTIMVSLPLALVGALLMLFLTNFPIGMPAMIGIILLMGLVTKNAILLVDYANELREQKGLSIVDAMLEAGPTRLRPILMTSAAMVLGMMPTAIGRGDGSAFRAPMAIAVIGGVIASTVLTLVVVPVAYLFMDRFTLRGRKERKGGTGGTPAFAHGPAANHPHGSAQVPPAAAASVALEEIAK